MEKYLEGKTAIVTGAGSGIGAATAVLFAQVGAQVVLSDINEKGGNEILKQIEVFKRFCIFCKSRCRLCE